MSVVRELISLALQGLLIVINSGWLFMVFGALLSWLPDDIRDSKYFVGAVGVMAIVTGVWLTDVTLNNPEDNGAWTGHCRVTSDGRDVCY